MITVDTVFVYLCQQQSWISDVQIAAELDSSIPITRKLLVELGDAIENDGDGNWRVVKATEVEIVPEDNSQLAISEEKELLRLERRVERGFYMAGVALKQIRDCRLYRQQYKTFEEYCRDRFDFSRVNAFYLIKSVEVVNNLTSNLLTNGYQNLPSSVRQIRPLTKLAPKQQLSAWQKAVSVAPNGKPSGKLVSQVVKEIQKLEKMDDFLIDNQEHIQSKTSYSQKQEGLNYKPGNNGCEWYVKVEQSTYEHLKDYQQLNGLPTLNSAISSLLSLVNHKL
jgi:hypothetical protein